MSLVSNNIRKAHIFWLELVLFEAGNLDVVKKLLETGADKDARDGYELTALHKVSFISGA